MISMDSAPPRRARLKGYIQLFSLYNVQFDASRSIRVPSGYVTNNVPAYPGLSLAFGC